MASIASSKFIQGALVITLTAGGIFYTTADSMKPAKNGCLIYKLVDGTSKKICGKSAALILNKTKQKKRAIVAKNRSQTAPVSTASLPSQQDHSCLALHKQGKKLGPICNAIVKLHNTTP